MTSSRKDVPVPCASVPDIPPLHPPSPPKPYPRNLRCAARPLKEREKQASTDDGRKSIPTGVNGRGCAASLRGPVAAASYATLPVDLRHYIIFGRKQRPLESVSVERTKRITIIYKLRVPVNYGNYSNTLGLFL
jgi:hypothetical protein